MKWFVLAATLLLSDSTQAWELNRIHREYRGEVKLKSKSAKGVKAQKFRPAMATRFEVIDDHTIRIVTAIGDDATQTLNRILRFKNKENTVVDVFVGARKAGSGWCAMNTNISRRFCNITYTFSRENGKVMEESEQIAFNHNYEQLSLIEWRNPEGYGFLAFREGAYPRRSFSGGAVKTTNETLILRR